MKIYVTNKACHECFMTPDRIFSGQEVREFVECALHDQEDGHVPECHCVTIARHKGKPLPFPTNAYTCCFAFFYCYGKRNIWLREAIEQGEIEYFDIDGWEGLKESGCVLSTTPSTGKKWENGPMTAEQMEWGERCLAKYGKSMFSPPGKVELPRKP